MKRNTVRIDFEDGERIEVPAFIRSASQLASLVKSMERGGRVVRYAGTSSTDDGTVVYATGVRGVLP